MAKKITKKKAKAKPKKKTAVKKPKIKALGKVTHFFDRISVAAIKLLAPLKVGDMIQIKGHVTDFTQKIESMQIEHQNVLKAKRGDEIGIKVKEKVRDHDLVYQAKEEPAVVQPPIVSPPPVKQQPEPKKPSSYSDTKFLKF